jgi:phosphopantetheinyl transferase
VVTEISEKIHASIIKEEDLFSEALITSYQLLQCTLTPQSKARLSHKHKPRFGLSISPNKESILRQEGSALLAQ